MKRPNDSGIALTLTIIVMLLLTALAGYALTASMHQGRLRKQTTLVRNKAYYWAQGGVVEAYARTRTRYMTLPGGGPLGGTVSGGGPADLTNPNFDPNPYCLDVDPNDPGNEVQVDIGPADAVTGLRPIVANAKGSDGWAAQTGC